MTRPLIAALAGLVLLSACSGFSQSNWNPVNWFGGSNEVAVAKPLPEGATPADPRPLVEQVLSMSVERYPGGAIVRATGLPPTQGYWDGELAQDPVKDGRLTFRFVLIPPPYAARVSTQQSREVIVGTSLSDKQLEGIREIVVQGARNARSSRR
jgi:hypothetical protein